jgi:hypothetical protein
MVSANIDKYFMLIDDEPIPAPSTYLTSEWEMLLASLATRKPEGWIEASFALLNCAYEDQEKFTKSTRKFIADFAAGKLDMSCSQAVLLKERLRSLYIHSKI